MSFLRLTRGDWLAAVAALALLLVMSLDWYGTRLGDDARRVEQLAQPSSRAAGEISSNLRDEARLKAESQEKTPWQAFSLTDLVLAAAIVLALAAAALRARGRRHVPPGTPSGVAAGVAALATLLLAYRILNPPGDNDVVTVKFGAFAGLLCLAAMAGGALMALRAEQDGRAFAEPEPAPGPDAGAAA